MEHMYSSLWASCFAVERSPLLAKSAEPYALWRLLLNHSPVHAPRLLGKRLENSIPALAYAGWVGAGNQQQVCCVVLEVMDLIPHCIAACGATAGTVCAGVS